MNGSTNSKSYSWLYKTKDWKQLRDSWLRFNCWCVMCQQIGIRRKATVVDHINPHKGNQFAFLDRTNLQSLCKSCHDSPKARVERGGVERKAIGVDGWHVIDGGRH